jgi:tetratricopeptide (TPR) repeat protein
LRGGQKKDRTTNGPVRCAFNLRPHTEILTLPIWYLRAETKAFVGRFTNPDTDVKVKHRDTELQLSTKTPAVSGGTEIVPVQATPDETSATAMTQSVPAQEAGDDLDFGKILESRDLEGLKQWYKKSLAEEVDPVRRRELDPLYYWIRSDFGDTSGLSELRKFAGDADPANRRLGLRFLGFALRTAGAYESAAEALIESAKLDDKPDSRAELLVTASQVLVRTDQAPKAIAILKEAAIAETAPEIKAKILRGLGQVFEKTDDHLNRGIAIERALQEMPNDPQAHFAAGYAFSNASLEALSLLHYQRSTKFEPNSPWALNNTGVQYQTLGLPIKGVASYKKAAEAKNTLAMANLAYLYLDAGFVDQANDIIEAARLEPEPHENVVAAAAEVNRRREDEGKRSNAILKNAEQQQQFMRDYAEAWLAEDKMPSLEGNWVASELTNLKVSYDVTHARFEISWIQGGVECRFSGIATSRYAHGKSEKKTFGWSDGKDAYAVVDSLAATVQLMTIHDHNAVITTIRRLAAAPAA